MAEKDCNFLRIYAGKISSREDSRYSDTVGWFSDLTVDHFCWLQCLIYTWTKPRRPQTECKRFKKISYVHNWVTSAQSKEEILKFIQESKQVLASACFHPRGWEHNSRRKGKEPSEPVPLLCLLWDKDECVLLGDLKPLAESNQVVTRRRVSSTVHKNFDPIAFLCSVALCPKLLIQNSWKLKSDWDATLLTYLLT